MKLKIEKILGVLIGLLFLGSGAQATDESTQAKWGYIDSSGKFIIEPKYKLAEPFSEGLAAVEVEVKNSDGSLEERFGYIDKSGKMVIAPLFAHAFKFVDGLAPVKIPSGGALLEKFDRECADKWGYIDKSGNFVTSP